MKIFNSILLFFKNAVVSLAIFVFTMSICLALAEVGVRCLKLVPNTQVEGKELSKDRLSFKPHSSWTHIEPEFIENVSINSLGYREEEVQLGTPAIVFLGDSQTFGTGVQYGKRASDHVKQTLKNSCRLFSPHIVNISMPGASTKKEVEMLKAAIKKGLHPIHTFLMVVSNDHAQNWEEAAKKPSTNQKSTSSFKRSVLNFLRKHRYDSHFAVFVLSRLASIPEFQKFYTESKVLGNWGELIYADAIYLKRKIAAQQFESTKEAILDLAEITPLTVVLVPDRYRYDNKLRQLLVANLSNKGATTNDLHLDQESAFFHNFQNHYQIQVLDPHETFQEVSNNHHSLLYYPINGHLNNEGQRLLGEYILGSSSFIRETYQSCKALPSLEFAKKSAHRGKDS